MCGLLIYTISISILCVSQEEPRLVESNKQIYDFYKEYFSKNKGIVDRCKVNFYIIKLFIQAIQVAAVRT